MITKEDAIQFLTEKHNGRYSYKIDTDLVRSHDKIGIICHKHGLFYQEYRNHAKGAGCKHCANIEKNEKKALTTEEFIKRASEAHNGKYSYEKTKYINSSTKIIVTCPEHGDFEIAPIKHLYAKHGCRKCSMKFSSSEEFIQECRKIHGDSLLYDRINYKNTNTKVVVGCKKHGYFEKYPYQLLNRKEGCPYCGREELFKKLKLSKEEYIKRYYSRHGERYDLSNITYIGSNEYINVYCSEKYTNGKEHGYFKILASNLMHGYGCPICAKRKKQSNGQHSIYELIENYDYSVTPNFRLKNRKEIDILVKDLNIGFEYDGIYWHSELKHNSDYHINKTNTALSENIQLYHIFEDEWECKQEIVKSRIRSIIGRVNNKIYARKCEVHEIDSKILKEFLETNHLQGNVNSKYRYGLYYNDKLVAVMCFGGLRKSLGLKSNEGEYELLRYCSKLNTSVIGGASKLLKYFIKEVNPKRIISYADKRWSNGNLYFKLGFKHIRDSKPNYFYIVNGVRENRFKYRKSELVKQGFDSNKSEHEIMLERGIPRIYDCGAMVFEMKL